jgi:hypothetical protein
MAKRKLSASSIDVSQYFLYDELTGKSKCLLLNCQSTFSGKVISNLKRHLMSSHKGILSESNQQNAHQLPASSSVSSDISNNSVSISINNNRKKVKVCIEPHNYIKGCIKLIAENNISYNTFNSEGFRLISTPIDSAIGRTMNSDNLSKIMADTSNNIRSQISAELKLRLVCLKVDAATKHQRSILGVNAQFLDNGKMEIRTLGMIELTQRHTSDYLKSEIENLLDQFGLSIKQLYSITVDNGANVVKMVKILEQEQYDSLEREDFEEINEQDDRTDENIMSFLESPSAKVLNCVRCAAHTLQLVVSDVSNLYKELKTKVRAIVNQMKKVKYRSLYIANEAQRPINDVDTRWMSFYLMTHNIKENLEFYKQLNDDPDHDLQVASEVFEFIEKFTVAFEPLFYTTKKFQTEQLTIGT